MAVTASFVADFSNFLAAAKSAEGALDKLSASAGVTERSVDKAAKSFSGESLIASAIRATDAVAAIGGASKLTATEMERVNRTVSQALEKFSALGIKPPEDMLRLADATKRLEGSASNASTSTSLLTSTFASMTAAFSAGAIINSVIGSLKNFASDAISSAGNLVDLRAATGLSLDMLQRFSLVAQQGGIELENLTKASFKLGNQLNNGSSSTREAVEKLGLSFTNLRQLKPEQQLDAVLRAAEPLADTTERNAILTTLFGEKAAVALARVVEGYSDLSDSVSIATDKQIESIDRATNAYDKLITTIGTGFQQSIGNLFRSLTETGLALDQMTESEKQYLQVLTRAGQDTNLYRIQLKDQREAQEKATKATADAAAAQNAAEPAQTNYIETLRKTRLEMQLLDPETRKQIKAARELGTSEEELMDRFGLTSTALKALADVEREAEAALKKHTQEVEKAEKAQKAFLASVTNLNKIWVPFKEGIEDVGESLHNLPSVSFADFASESSKARIEAEKLAQSTSGVLATSIRQVSPALADAEKSASKFSGAVAGLGATIVGAFQGGGNPFKAVGASLGNALGQDLGASAAKAIGGKLGSALGSAMGPLGAMAGQLLGAGMSKAMGWIKGLFSDPMKKEIEAANAEIAKLKSAMMEQGGSVDELEARYNAMGLSIREAFGGEGLQGVAALKAAQDEFNKRVDESKIKLDEMKGKLSGLQTELKGLIDKAYEMGYVFNEAGMLTGFNFDKVAQVAKEFGVDLAGLGTAFQQAQLTAESQKVIDAFTLMTMAGGSVGVVLNGMKDEINKIVIDSLQFGTKIPENMKPMIDQLIKQGDLTDKNGKKITDMANLKFGEPVKTEYEKINGQIKIVVDAMAELIGKIDAMVAAIDAAMRPRTLVTTAVYVDPGPPPGFGSVDSGGNRNDRRGGDNADVSGDGFATGTMGKFGRWFANFGAGTKTTLHGNEAVVRADQAAAFASDMGGDGGGMASEIAGLRADINSLLPRAIGRAVRDAMQMSGVMA